jgi:hypothetical protein
MARNPNRKSQAFKIKINGKAAQNAYGLSDLVGRFVGRIDKAKTRAAAGVARRAAPVASRAVRSVFNVKSRDLSGKIRAIVTGDSLRVLAFNRRIPLIAFGGKWRGRKSVGSTASVIKGSRETFNHSFIASVNGLRSIRVRQKRGERRVHRGPVQILYGPSPRDMIIGRKSDPETRSPMGFYPPRLRDQISNELIGYYVIELRRLIALESKNG